jgi:mRNA interferase MazF
LTDYKPGDIVYVDLGEVIGHEQEGSRPAVIIANPLVGAKSLGLLTIVPLTRTEKSWWTMVKITKDDGGVKDSSFAMCHQIRTVSEKRIKDRWGCLAAGTLGKIKTVLASMMDL